MAARALIVDDSKSARAFLARILEKHALEVDSAESAEQAIEYLTANRPDVIFMDHQMPGMDGFQAVQAIKNNPRTATIPIMMYTSQEGELYLSQARALGAVGVLPKQIQPADVSKVLYQLHLIPDRRSSGQSSFRAVPAEGAGPAARAADAHAGERPLGEAAVAHHLGELRRALTAALDQHTERVLEQLQELQPGMIARSGRGRFARRTAWLPWSIAAVAAAVAVALAILAWQQSVQQQLLAAQVAQLSQAATTDAQLAALAVPAAPPPAVSPPPAPAAPPAATADAAKPTVETFPYGAEPFSGPRLDALRTLFDRLATQGFHGTVDIRLFSGRFCLIGNPTDGYSVAPDDTPYARCDTVAGTQDDAGALSARVPVTVADLIGSLRVTTHDAVRVQIAAGDGSTAAAYPQITDTLTAGEWNRAAGANNRIEIRLRRS